MIAVCPVESVLAVYKALARPGALSLDAAALIGSLLACWTLLCIIFPASWCDFGYGDR